MKHFYVIILFFLSIFGNSNPAFHNNFFNASAYASEHGGEHEEHTEEQERGTHGGKLFRNGDFSLELTIYEKNVEPHFRIYLYDNNKPVLVKDADADADIAVTLTRLDNEVNIFNFTPQDDYLLGDSVVVEPHSFDVKITATYKNKTYNWTFASYEGRTSIDDAMAEKNGVKTEQATEQTLYQYLPLTGRIVSNPNATAQIRGRFSGIVKNVSVNWGQNITKGQVLATIESNKSLTNYTVTSPINGIVTQRNTNIGDVTGNNVLFVISDYSTVWVQANIFQDDLKNIKIGYPVTIQSLTGEHETTGKISMFLPKIDANSQTTTAVIPIDNPNNIWSPDMLIKGNVLIASQSVPIAVKTSALQKFRDFTVVFEKVNNTYEVRMLDLGFNNGEWVEVISGLKPNATYVTENSFLIKADIEKSGASHDH
jgi:cobalt-zinc-cadmium efflux system membrane fusion protein